MGQTDEKQLFSFVVSHRFCAEVSSLVLMLALGVRWGGGLRSRAGIRRPIQLPHSLPYSPSRAILSRDAETVFLSRL